MPAALAWASAASASRSSPTTASPSRCSSRARASSRFRARSTCSRTSNPSAFQLALELRHYRKEVADQTNVGGLEDRRFAILVDGDDRARILDAGHVLDRTGNADRHVELRRDDLAGLADLHVVRDVARVHGRARSAHRSAEALSQAEDDLEVVGTADAASAGYDARSALQIRTAARRRRTRDEPRM